MSRKMMIAVGVAAALLTAATGAASLAIAATSSNATGTAQTAPGPGWRGGGGIGMRGGGGMMGRGFGGPGGGIAGTVTAKSGDTVTVKTLAGWSRTFELSSSVTYQKVVDAKASDVSVGSKVQLGAQPDGQGDVTVDRLTIVPELPAPPVLPGTTQTP